MLVPSGSAVAQPTAGVELVIGAGIADLSATLATNSVFVGTIGLGVLVPMAARLTGEVRGLGQSHGTVLVDHLGVTPRVVTTSVGASVLLRYAPSDQFWVGAGAARYWPLDCRATLLNSPNGFFVKGTPCRQFAERTLVPTSKLSTVALVLGSELSGWGMQARYEHGLEPVLRSRARHTPYAPLEAHIPSTISVLIAVRVGRR